MTRMAFAHVLASNGLGYFLCSLGYFLLGVILLTQLKRETHLPAELQALKILAIYGLVRGTFYFGELFFLISYQQVSPLTNGLVHELIWIGADYLTVLVFFAFALRLAINSSFRKGLHALLSGMIVYWVIILGAANHAGLNFASLSTWFQLKPFFLCIPSFLIVVISFNHLSRRLRIIGYPKSAEYLRHLATAYSIQAVLVFLAASAHMTLIPHPNSLGLGQFVNNIPVLRFLSALVLMSIIYLVYSLFNSKERSANRTEPNRVENGLVAELAFSLTSQISNVLEVDAVALFLAPADDEPEILCAIQGSTLRGVQGLSGEPLTKEIVQDDLARRYKTIHRIPIELNSHRIGSILIANRKRRPLSLSDLRFLNSVAAQTGRTVLGIRSLVQNIEAEAIQEERLRISREMHDGLSPLLAYVRFKIELAKTLLEESDQNPLSPTLSEIDDVIEEAFSDVRETISGLRSSVDDQCLLTQIKTCVNQFQKQCAARVEFDCPDQLPHFGRKHHLQVLRIIQEVFSNIRKHAKAERVILSVHTSGRGIEIVITDDGIGFNMDNILEGHFGLSTMRERAAEIKAKLGVTSELNKGTTVRLSIPITEKESKTSYEQSIDHRRPRSISRRVSEPDLVQG